MISGLKGWLNRELASIFEKNEARSISRLLTEEYLGFSPTGMLVHADDEISREVFGKFQLAIEKLRSNIPVQYVLGKASFLGLDLKVGPGVLIPRPETEELALLIINDLQGHCRDIKILDIGTGTACLPLALDKHVDNIELTGIDASKTALAYAKENVSAYDAEVKLIQMDFLDKVNWGSLESYDFVISNPPYVTEEDIPAMQKNVIDQEPDMALFSNENRPLLFYEKIIEFSLGHLREGGCIYLEINQKYGRKVVSLLKENGFDKVVLLKDIRGKDRFTRACKGNL